MHRLRDCSIHHGQRDPSRALILVQVQPNQIFAVAITGGSQICIAPGLTAVSAFCTPIGMLGDTQRTSGKVFIAGDPQTTGPANLHRIGALFEQGGIQPIGLPVIALFAKWFQHRGGAVDDKFQLAPWRRQQRRPACPRIDVRQIPFAAERLEKALVRRQVRKPAAGPSSSISTPRCRVIPPAECSSPVRCKPTTAPRQNSVWASQRSSPASAEEETASKSAGNG